MSFVPFSPFCSQSRHHWFWQFNITPFLAPYSWTKMFLAAERGSQTTVFSWLNEEFISPTHKEVITQRLVPKSTLKIKDLSWATEVLIGQIQLSKISFYVNQLKQDNWEMSALLNIYTSWCKYLFTYHLFAIFITSSLCKAAHKLLDHVSWCLN